MSCMLYHHRSFWGGRLVAVLGRWAVLALAKPPLVFVAGFIECSLPMAWWSARVRAGCRVFAHGKVGYLAGWPTCAQLAWFPSRLPGWVKQLRFPFHEDGNLQRGVASRRNHMSMRSPSVELNMALVSFWYVTLSFGESHRPHIASMLRNSNRWIQC